MVLTFDLLCPPYVLSEAGAEVEGDNLDACDTGRDLCR